MTTKKTTKKEMFNAILADLTKTEQIEFIGHELELLDRKKNAISTDSKLALANNLLADALYDFMEENTCYRASEFINKVEGISNTSKATAILTILCNQHRADRYVEQNKPYFVKRV